MECTPPLGTAHTLLLDKRRRWVEESHVTRKLFVACQLPLNSLGNFGTERAHVWVAAIIAQRARNENGKDRRLHLMFLMSPNA